MTKKEALIVLGASENEDELSDFLEDALFEIKQFILSKPLVSKLIAGQIKKLEKLSEAVQILNIDTRNISFLKEESFYLQSKESILSIFNSFESKKAQLKQLLISVVSPSDSIKIISQLMKLQEEYSSCWPLLEVKEEEGVIISKEPDAMELLDEIKKMSAEGTLAFQQLAQISLDNYPTIKQEMKRLSLLRKKETEWKISLKN